MEKTGPSSENDENEDSLPDANQEQPENSSEGQDGKIPAALLAEALDVDDP